MLVMNPRILILRCFLLGLLLTLSAHARQSNRLRPPSNERLGVENPKALSSFFAALSASKLGKRPEPVRVMHFGDSHIAADVFTRELRRRFQTEYGDGGAGFIVPRNPMATRRSGVVSGATDGWVVEGIGGRNSPDNIYGPAGINLATSSPGERAWLETSCNHFEVYFARQPGGGKIDIGIDGVSALDAPLTLTARAPQLDSIFFELPDDSLHRIEVRTLSPGKVRLLGIVAEHVSPGVSYDVFGINGARARRLLSWNQTALTAAIKGRSPDLIIVAYGTNEVTESDWSAESYELLIGNILQRLRVAAPQASILVCAPPDRSDLHLSGRLQALSNAERRAAIANHAAFWDASSAMGGPGSMNRWVRLGFAQQDRVHLTTSGYARLADQLYDGLKRAQKNL